MTATFKPLGDRALLVEFDRCRETSVHRRILSLHRSLMEQTEFSIDFATPGVCSLAVGFSPLTVSHQTVRQWIEDRLLTPVDDRHEKVRRRRIPVCYQPDFAVDLPDLSNQTGLASQEIIQRHHGRTYRALMLGFLPGFAYLGPVDPAIQIARKRIPRTQVPSGSVAIAGDQTGVYPISAPGGWQVIGRTPIEIYCADRNPPFLISPGDEVDFFPIDGRQFDAIAAQSNR